MDVDQMMITLLNMSITAGFAALLVMALRLLYRRLPKRFSCVLWLVVIFRFLCPFSLQSAYSLLPFYSNPLEERIIYENTPSIDSGVFFIDRPVNQVLEQTMTVTNPYMPVNPIQILLFVMLVVWEAGMLVFFLFHFSGYIRLKWRLGTAVKIQEPDPDHEDEKGRRPEHGIYESDRIPGAFVMGIFRPVIYLPSNLTEMERECVLRHERIHIRRRDYLVKLLGLLMVIVHWFNPIAHIAFRLLCKDMEMSCDEAVVSELGEGGKRQYSLALLSAAEKGSGARLPLAFGESHTKSRIKNVLNYKKAGFRITLCAVIVTAAVVLCLMTVREKPVDPEAVSIIGGGDGPTSIFIAGKDDGETPAMPVEMPDTSWLSGQVLEKGLESTITIDYASKDQIIFHGSCGLFSFQLKDGKWVPNLIIGPVDTGTIDLEAITSALDAVKKEPESEDSVHREDSFVGKIPAAGSSFIDYDVEKLADGSIAVLGGMGTSSSNGGLTGKLVDVFYGWYNPDDMVMHQAYLFAGDGTMVENNSGEIEERRYLFTTDGADYFLRTPQTALEFELQDGKEPESLHFPYDRLELVRNAGGSVQVLDPMVIMGQPESQKMVLAEGRIYYYGAAKADILSFKSHSLIGIRTDGSDRRVAGIDYSVCRGLSYDNGYLYYEGWKNAMEFPRPIYRMKPDFSEITKLGDFNGNLISVVDGTFYLLSAEKPAIVLTREGRFDEVMYYDKCGYDAKNYECVAASAADGKLAMKFVNLSENGEYVNYEIPLAAGDLWKKVNKK